MRKIILSIILGIFTIMPIMAVKSDEQLQREEDAAGFVGVLITLGILLIAYLASRSKGNRD